MPGRVMLGCICSCPLSIPANVSRDIIYAVVLDGDSLDLIEGDFVTRAVIKLRRPW